MKPERYKQIEELYHAALGRTPEERAAFLEQSCGDEQLRGEVQSLLGYDQQAEQFIETPPDDVAVAMLAVEQKLSMVGRTLGHYRVVSLLGSGGMGEVYLAEDTRLNRRVALKLLPAAFTADRERLRRFEREAQAASALNHPNIITIHEIAQVDHLIFIVTEFIEGQTLRHLIASGRMKLPIALQVAMQVASALAAAHVAGIVHRDLKPENIMLRPDGLIKVLDFGLAKLTENQAPSADSQAATAAMLSTEAGMVMGTARYMSPEQARGLKVDERTDIFSLGVVLYEMLAGRAPFAGETTADVISVLLHKEPQPLSRVAPDLPAELQHIVSKALRKDKDERYQTAKDLLTDLKALKQELDFAAKLERSGEQKDAAAQNRAQAAPGNTAPQDADTQTGTVRQTSSAEYLASRIKQHRGGFFALLAVLLLAAIGFSYWLYNGRGSNPGQIESIAVLPFVNESGNSDVEYLSDGMTESLINTLSQLPNLSVKARSTVFRYKGKDVGPPQVGSELNVQAVLNGRVVQRGEQLTLGLELVDARTGNQIWGEQYNRKADDLLALQGEIARDVSNKLRMKFSGADEQRLAKTYTANAEAYKLYLQGRFYWNKRTVKDLQKAIEYFQQAVTVDQAYALGYAGLADAYALLSNYRGAPPREAMPKAKDAALKALSLDNKLAEAYTALGLILSDYDYDFAGSEREYKLAIELNPNYASAHHYYGNLLSRLGRHEESFAEFRRALEIDPLSLIINRMYADGLFRARKYDESIAQLKKTLELDANFVSAYSSLSNAYQLRGNYVESVEAFAKHQELNGEHENAAIIRQSFARGGWQRFLRMMTEGHRLPNLEFYTIATFHAALGENDKAFAELNKSYERRENTLVWLIVDPRLDPLRLDPRFKDLLRRVGF